MAHPFQPMTNEMLQKLTRMMQDSISTPKFYEQRFVFSIPKTRPIEELNSQISETNLSNLRTNNRY
jgi:hypothetical protein